MLYFLYFHYKIKSLFIWFQLVVSVCLYLSFVLSHFVCLALYERELEEEEEEEVVGSEDEPEVLRLPDLLFRRPPQLLHYTAALNRPYDDDTYTYDPEHPQNFEQREELTIISKISKRNPEG